MTVERHQASVIDQEKAHQVGYEAGNRAACDDFQGHNQNPTEPVTDQEKAHQVGCEAGNRTACDDFQGHNQNPTEPVVPETLPRLTLRKGPTLEKSASGAVRRG